MSIFHEYFGYAETDYSTTPYATSYALASQGFQAQLVIEDKKDLGFQAEGVIDATQALAFETQGIIDTEKVQAFQAQLVIATELAFGLQAQGVIESDDAIAFQAEAFVETVKSFGFQSLLTVEDAEALALEAFIEIEAQEQAGAYQARGFIDTTQALGFHALITKLHHRLCKGYSEHDYASWPYATPTMCASQGFQAVLNIAGVETTGFQSQLVISDEKDTGFQAQLVIDSDSAVGFQTLVIGFEGIGFQALSILYNTDNLRILCEFASRGAATGSGLNAWLNPIAKGLNWLASTTKGSSSGSFDVTNLNTDIVEQYWRSDDGIVTGINLDCDTELPQGVFLDTFTMFNHNLTSSALVQLIGSPDSNFSTIGTIIPITITAENAAYIAPDLPLEGFRYWRLAINDVTNPDGFIRIGTIAFGSAVILQGECFVDRITRSRVNFKDEVFTEGQTNVMNDRGLKQRIRLDFRNLDFNKGNYARLVNIFNTSRTVNKCIWIPTPKFPLRYMTFGKLTRIPEETHNVKGEMLDYIDMTVEVDESR